MAKIVLNSTPQSISDGTKKVYLTSRAGYSRLFNHRAHPIKPRGISSRSSLLIVVNGGHGQNMVKLLPTSRSGK